MANDKKGSRGNFADQGRWIILFIIVVAVILISGRGTLRDRSIRVGSPSSSGTVEEELSSRPLPPPTPLPPLDTGLTPPSGDDSDLRNQATLSIGAASSEDPDREFIDLIVSFSNQEKILITGWSVENSKGERFQIGTGTRLPFSGQPNPQDAIQLDPGARAHITTGLSPIGTSFRTNLCTGYFEQFDDFEPRLREDCPRPEDEDAARGLENDCIDFLETIQSCRQPFEIPFGTDNECRNYANTKINYATCVDLHRGEAEFFENEWYIYLGRPSEIWKERRETIILRDREGKIIDTLSF